MGKMEWDNVKIMLNGKEIDINNLPIEAGMFDMSSSEPHIMINCPICNKIWQKKVEEKELETPCECKLKYTLKETSTGQVDIKFSIPFDKIGL